MHFGQNLRFMLRRLDAWPNTAVSLRGLALHPVPTWLSLTILELSTVWMYDESEAPVTLGYFRTLGIL